MVWSNGQGSCSSTWAANWSRPSIKKRKFFPHCCVCRAALVISQAPQLTLLFPAMLPLRGISLPCPITTPCRARLPRYSSSRGPWLFLTRCVSIHVLESAFQSPLKTVLGLHCVPLGRIDVFTILSLLIKNMGYSSISLDLFFTSSQECSYRVLNTSYWIYSQEQSIVLVCGFCNLQVCLVAKIYFWLQNQYLWQKKLSRPMHIPSWSPTGLGAAFSFPLSYCRQVSFSKSI